MNEIAYYLFLISIFGGIGGLILGISNETSTKITLPGGDKFELGFLGDLLIGATSAIAFFTFSISIINIDMANLNKPNECLKLASISVIAGFAGLRLLENMSEKLLKQFDKKVDEVDDKIHSFDISQKAHNFVMQGEFSVNNRQYDEAISHYNLALDIDPENKIALYKKGFALKRLNRIPEALDCVNRALEIDEKYSPALYNRACYKSILGYDLEEVLKDLADAINNSKSKTYKIWAKKDEDLKKFHNDPKFIKIVG